MVKRHLWVLLPALPFPFWSRDLLVRVENTIGHFVTVDDDFQLIYDKRMACVLVEMDLSRGLPAEIDILCNEMTICQKLDYLHVPFRCNRCHVVSHLRCSCPILLHGTSSLTYSDESRSLSCDDPSLMDSPPLAPDILVTTPDGLYNSHSP